MLLVERFNFKNHISSRRIESSDKCCPSPQEFKETLSFLRASVRFPIFCQTSLLVSGTHSTQKSLAQVILCSFMFLIRTRPVSSFLSNLLQKIQYPLHSITDPFYWYLAFDKACFMIPISSRDFLNSCNHIDSLV